MEDLPHRHKLSRLTRKEWALFALPLLVFLFYFCVRFLPLPATKNDEGDRRYPASAVVASPDESATAQVFRWEHEPTGNEFAQVPDDIDHGNTWWVLQVTRSDGTQCNLGLQGYTWHDEVNDEDLAAMRKVDYRLSWDKEGRFITYNGPRRDSGKAIYLKTCLRKWKGPTRWVEQCFLGAKPKPLTTDLRQRLQGLGRTEKEIARLKYVQVQGNYYGTAARDFINMHPNVLVVIGPKYNGHSQFISYGPIITLGSAHFMGELASQQWIFLDDQSFPRGLVDATEVFVAPGAELNQAHFQKKPTLVP